VLVVEDEPTVARLIGDVLEDDGFRVDLLLDGREALKRAASEDYDLVICDMKMPRLNGQRFYKTLARTGNPLREKIPVCHPRRHRRAYPCVSGTPPPAARRQTVPGRGAHGEGPARPGRRRPRAIGTRASAKKPRREEMTMRPIRDQTILLVSDDIALCAAARRELESRGEGLRVAALSTVDAARRIVEDAAPAVILLEETALTAEQETQAGTPRLESVVSALAAHAPVVVICAVHQEGNWRPWWAPARWSLCLARVAACRWP
jgi:CheY-like chemotaxis protein